jgi:hypothetical protein
MAIPPITLNGEFSVKPSTIKVVTGFLAQHKVIGLGAPILTVLNGVRLPNPERLPSLQLFVYKKMVPTGSPDPHRSYDIAQDKLASHIKGFFGIDNPYQNGNVAVKGPNVPQSPTPSAPQVIQEAKEAVAVNDETMVLEGAGYIVHTKIGGVPNEILAATALANEIFPSANVKPLLTGFVTELKQLAA